MTKDKYNIFLLAESFSENFGGRTKATFLKANLLTDHSDNLFVLTTNFKVDYQRILSNIKQKRDITEKLKLANVFEFYAEETLFSNEESIQMKIDSSYIQKKEYVYEKSDGEKKIVITLRKDGSCSSIKEYYNNKILSNSLYDFQNVKRRTQFYSLVTNESVETTLYRANGSPYLIHRYSNGNCHYIAWVKDDAIIKEFSGPDDLHDFWISELNRMYNHAFFFSEVRNLDHTLIKNPYCSDIAHMAIIHSTHLQKPYTSFAETNQYIQPLVENMEAYDAILTLTHEQKHDLQLRYGVHDNIHTLRNPIEKISTEAFTQKKENRIVVVSRLEKLKRIDHIIRAMIPVIKRIPNAVLDIYGTGSQEEALKKLIEENHLEHNVFLKGYTHHPIQEFASAQLFVITSEYEGLGYTILESLLVGTPVIAYDFKYGPKDLIVDGINGRIVPNGEITQLSEKMLELLTDKETLTEMSKNALEVDTSFDPKVVKANLLKIMKKVKQQKETNKKISPILLGYSRKEFSMTILEDTVTIELDLDLKILNENDECTYYLYINDVPTDEWNHYRIFRGDKDSNGLRFTLEFPASAKNILMNKSNTYQLGVTYASESKKIDCDDLFDNLYFT